MSGWLATCRERWAGWRRTAYGSTVRKCLMVCLGGNLDAQGHHENYLIIILI